MGLMGDPKDWMKGAVSKPGALRSALGVKKGKKIPAKKLEVEPGDSPLMKKRKSLAKTFKRFRPK